MIIHHVIIHLCDTLCSDAEELTPIHRERCRTMDKPGTVEEATSIIELSPFGHGARASYDSAVSTKHHSGRSCEFTTITIQQLLISVTVSITCS